MRLGRLQLEIGLDVIPGHGSRWYHFLLKRGSTGTELTPVTDNGTLHYRFLTPFFTYAFEGHWRHSKRTKFKYVNL